MTWSLIWRNFWNWNWNWKRGIIFIYLECIVQTWYFLLKFQNQLLGKAWKDQFKTLCSPILHTKSMRAQKWHSEKIVYEPHLTIKFYIRVNCRYKNSFFSLDRRKWCLRASFNVKKNGVSLFICSKNFLICWFRSFFIEKWPKWIQFFKAAIYCLDM